MAGTITVGELLSDPTSNNKITIGSGTTLDLVNGAGSVLIDRSSVSGAGKVLQVVDITDATASSHTGNLPDDDTIPTNTEGSEIISGSFTPVSATSTFYCTLSAHSHRTINQTNVTYSVFTSASANAIGVTRVYTTGASLESTSFAYNIASTSTSALTFSARIGSATTSYMNGFSGSRKYGGVMATVIRIIEVEG
jgi:hypothetical protein